MRFSINLTTRVYLDQRLLNLSGFVIISLLLVSLGWNVSRISSGLGEQHRLAAGIRELEDKLNSRPKGVSEKDFMKQQDRNRFFNEIIERKSRDWLGMLDLLENVTPEGVTLASLTPGKNSAELRIDGRAKSFSYVRKYLEKLEGSKSFSEVLLLSHQDMVVGGSSRGVQFTLSCKVQF